MSPYGILDLSLGVYTSREVFQSVTQENYFSLRRHTDFLSIRANHTPYFKTEKLLHF